MRWRVRLRFVLPLLGALGCGLNLVGAPLGDAGGGEVEARDGSVEEDATDEFVVLPLEDAQALDATPRKDVTVIDAPPPIDAMTDGGCPVGRFLCPTTGTCVASCLACTKNELRCPTTLRCVPDCEACPNNAFECWACGSENDTALVFVGCTATTNPTGGCYVSGRVHCKGCQQGGCYGGQQVCVALQGNKSECRGCGEQNTNGAACAANGTCEAAKLQCK